MSTAASQYLREVKKRIHYSGSQKTEFLCQLEAEVIYYCEDHNDVDFATLSACFGTPEDIADNFISELGTDEVRKIGRTRKRILYLIATFIIVTTILVIGVELYTYHIQQKFEDVQFIESITYEGELTPDVTSSTYATEYYYSEEDNETIE